jgi:hypothetical protein
MKAVIKKISSETMARTNRKCASERMKKKNPMFCPEVKIKAIASRRARGDWKPPMQGGNGRPLPLAQKILADALGWPTEVYVPTGFVRTPGYPQFYLIDIAYPEMKIAVEVDGNSHKALKVRERDARKEAFLAGLGWTILRFTNKEVLENLEGCVQKVLSTISKLNIPIPS